MYKNDPKAHPPFGSFRSLRSCDGNIQPLKEQGRAREPPHVHQLLSFVFGLDEHENDRNAHAPFGSLRSLRSSQCGWFRVADSELQVSGFEFRVSVFGFRASSLYLGHDSEAVTILLLVWGFGFWVSGSGFRVSGFGFRMSGFGTRVAAFGLRI